MELNDQNFKETVENAGVPTLVYFGAEWCGPCKMMKPILVELETEFAEQYIIAKIDVNESPETSASFGIRNIPSMLILKDGNIVDKKVGAQQKQIMIDWLQDHE